MELKTEDLIAEAKKFFNSYKKKIGESIRKLENIVIVNFNDLSSFSHELSDVLLERPEEIIDILESALEETGLVKNPRVRFEELPAGSSIKIRDIRAKHLGKFIWVEGIVRQASDVRPQVVSARFECPSCGTIISVLQLEKKFKEPSRCSCGRKGFFKLVSKQMVDAQRLVIEESSESLSGGEQPRRINVFLKEDLVEPKMEERTTPGSKIRIFGILNEVPVPLQTGAISTRFDLAIDSNNVIPLEESYNDLDISDEEERQIKELALDPNVFINLSENIAPSIYGYEEIKQSIVLQLFGGVRKERADGTFTRGDIHILLIGDPGVAKSVTLGFISKIAPRGRYVVGKSTSGAGLTASVIKDEFLKGWSLEAGAMVLSSKGVLCIDEIEKMDPDDRSSMHEAMEQQCMLPNFKLMLANGKYVKIGNFVDKLIEKNKKKVYQGKDCEILPVKNVKLLSTDFNTHFPINAKRVSRHTAPKEFVSIVLTNGRKIVVTPEHPCWIVKDGKITTIPAENLKSGMYFPVTSKLDIDVIPGCTDKISQIFKKLKISAKQTIGHSIDLHVEKQRVFLQKLVRIAESKLNELLKTEDITKYSEIIVDLAEIKKLAFGYARWMKIKEASKVENKDVKWVYDVTVEPYHTFISNTMILHNTVTISKANVQASLRAETSVLAAGNPKFGRFDPYMPIAQQVDIQPTLLNRFDIIFMLRDLPDKIKDNAIATHVLGEHQTPTSKGTIEPELFRKYIAYAKQKVEPKLTDEAISEIKSFYVGLRNSPSVSESAVRPIPITARQLSALVRLSEASAKTRLSDKVDKQDAVRAINIMKYYLMQAGFDQDTNSFDIDKIVSGVTASKRGKIMEVKGAIMELEGKLGKLIPLEELEKDLEGKVEKIDLEEALDKLTISGDIFHPKKGFIQLV